LVVRLRTAQVQFLIEPRVRFSGKAGEQGVLFIRDPSENTLEFKSFKDIESQLFAH
jgi:extradiol dioxygenase family protein